MADDFTSSAFFRAYAPWLRAFLSPRISPRLLRRFDEDDVLNSAFRSFFLRQSAILDDSDQWNPWPLLVEIAVHKLARQVRRNTAQCRGIGQEVKGTDSAVDWSGTPDDHAEFAEILTLVEDALPVDERQAWQLRLEGWELQEIAERLQLSERTVRRYLHQAKDKLQNLLQAVQQDHQARSSPQPFNAENRTGWTSFSHFKLLRQIGVGSVGKVYQALDKRTGKLVAIKFMKKHFTGHSIARESILSEIEFGTRLRHPAVIRLDGIGITPNEGLFLVMEYLPGGNLAELLSKKRPGLSLLRDWLLTLLDGLDFAHSSGIIHCDLKPANVLFDADGRPKVGDFGLAQWMIGRVRCIHGGTPAYLAPELLDPMFGNPGPWTDVFGVGAIIREAITGHPPYAGASTATILSQVLTTEPIAWPNERAAKVPVAWKDLCNRCLEKFPHSRWGSMRELRQVAGELPID